VATKRTTHRATSGEKLYAVRDKKGQLKNIQTYLKYDLGLAGRSKAERAEISKRVMQKAAEEDAVDSLVTAATGRRVFIPIVIGNDRFILLATPEQAERGGHNHFLFWSEARQWLKAK